MEDPPGGVSQRRPGHSPVALLSGTRQALLDAEGAWRSAAIGFAREPIAIPAENPPGNEQERCAAAIARKLREIGLEPRVATVRFPRYGGSASRMTRHPDKTPQQRTVSGSPAIRAEVR